MEKSPWFSTKAQIIQTVVPILALLLGATVQTLVTAMAQKAMGVPQDWWIMGSVFLGALCVMWWISTVVNKMANKRLGPQLAQVEMITSAAADIRPGELEETIRRWLDDFSFQIKRNEEREGSYFSFTIQGDGQIPIQIMRLKKTREQFITLVGAISVVKEDQEKLNSLPEYDRQRIYSEIAIEIRRQKIATRADFPQRVSFETRVLISELTQSKLIDRIDDIDYAIGLTILKFRLLLDETWRRNESPQLVPPLKSEQ